MNKKIEFTKTQQRLLQELVTKFQLDFNNVLSTIYKELGIEKEIQLPGNRIEILPDMSGISLEIKDK